MRVLLADDHAIFREGLRAILSDEPGVEVVADVADGREAVAVAQERAPDVVVMDLSMPGLNGIDATRAIVEQSPNVKVLCLSMHADRHMVAAALSAGATGYVLKNCASTELTEALRTVASHRTYLSPAVAGDVVRDYVARLSATEAANEPQLTRRERETLQLIAEGHSTKDIAVRLGISAKTVATHREHIMAKLDVHNVAGLTRYAIRHGITSVDDVPGRLSRVFGGQGFPDR